MERNVSSSYDGVILIRITLRLLVHMQLISHTLSALFRAQPESVQSIVYIFFFFISIHFFLIFVTYNGFRSCL